jgi:hypothetical protein
MLDYDILNELITPDFASGKLFWNSRSEQYFETQHQCKNWNNRYAGKEALISINSYGYKHGSIMNLTHKAHRVLWVLYTKEIPDIVDHIDGNRLNNNIRNLRNISTSENNKNLHIYSNNTSGVIGVSFGNNKWIANIGYNGKKIYLGSFENIEDAIEIRKQAEIEYSYHRNHGRNTISK